MAVQLSMDLPHSFTVKYAKSVCKNVPVLWFSNDNGFGAQSYRLGCAYFHKKPVSPQILSAAIARCV